MARTDGRAPDALRPVRFTRGYLKHAHGLVPVRARRHRRAVRRDDRRAASPAWRRGSGLGWVTAEYSLLPASTHDAHAPRGRRPAASSGRTHEIQRLIGRSLRTRRRPRRAGRGVHRQRRLRRPPGRRRHAHRGDHRRVHRAARRARDLARRRQDRRAAAARPRRRDLRRRRRRRAPARPRLRRGLRAEVDMNVVMDGDGPLHRGAGHRRARAVRPRSASTSCSTSRPAGIDELVALQREAIVGGHRDRMAAESASASSSRPRNKGKLVEIRAALAPPGWEFVAGEDLGSLPDVEETGDDLLRQRAASRPTRTTATSAASPALADDSGLEVDALKGAPGRALRALRGREGRRDADNNAQAAARARRRAAATSARRASAARSCSSTRTGRVVTASRDVRGPHRARAARHRRLRLRPALPARRDARARRWPS